MICKLRITTVAALFLFSLASCQKDSSPNAGNKVSSEVERAVKDMGFYNQNILSVEGGYVVEGDIFLSSDDISRNLKGSDLRVGESEQYHTTNRVTGLPRVITVTVDLKLPASYVTATDNAIGRYNAENLQVTFQRVSDSADITIKPAPRSAQYLASAGFPTSAGVPYNTVLVSTRQIGSQPENTVASILAHEMGHCIGFRHTDYADRSYSCGGGYSNEGQSTVGAILIPGTPAGPDPDSWMLACIGSGQNRPFNTNDKTALNYLY